MNMKPIEGCKIIKNSTVRFEVLTAVVKKSSIFRGITVCSLLKDN
jgi:hypothetical protein